MLTDERSPWRAAPMSPSKLTWIGTLISAATGFDSFLARSSALS
jgi:hypothetical protein